MLLLSVSIKYSVRDLFCDVNNCLTRKCFYTFVLPVLQL